MKLSINQQVKRVNMEECLDMDKYYFRLQNSRGHYLRRSGWAGPGGTYFVESFNRGGKRNYWVMKLVDTDSVVQLDEGMHTSLKTAQERARGRASLSQEAMSL